MFAVKILFLVVNYRNTWSRPTPSHGLSPDKKWLTMGEHGNVRKERDARRRERKKKKKKKKKDDDDDDDDDEDDDSTYYPSQDQGDDSNLDPEWLPSKRALKRADKGGRRVGQVWGQVTLYICKYVQLLEISRKPILYSGNLCYNLCILAGFHFIYPRFVLF